MHVFKKVGIAAGAAAAAALSLALAVPANADSGAQSGDIVGVGSDTLQNAVNFAIDGAPGTPGGYNTLGNKNRVLSFDATGDDNGRALYSQNSSTTVASTIILRGGSNPVTRPNGSGAGVGALIADSGYNGTSYQGLPNGSIQFARMSRLPKSSETTSCPQTPANSCGGLHVYQIAADTLSIVHNTATYNGVASLTAQQLVHIYQCDSGYTHWNDSGINGTNADTIVPLIPQDGSGTRTFFLDALAAANNNTAITLGGCVKTVQEHDPNAFTGTAYNVADAVSPFSGAKLKLLNDGYFAAAGTSGANAAYAPNFLTPLTGSGSFTTTRGVYIVVRQSDVASTTAFQPGTTANWVSALITSSNSAFRSASGRSELVAAGFTANGGANPTYIDCGINPASC